MRALSKLEPSFMIFVCVRAPLDPHTLFDGTNDGSNYDARTNEYTRDQASTVEEGAGGDYRLTLIQNPSKRSDRGTRHMWLPLLAKNTVRLTGYPHVIGSD